MPVHRDIDKNFFKKWSDDMAYILGFLFADGNIIKTKRNTHFLAFSSADYELLFSMRKAMKSTHVISGRGKDKKSVFVLQVGSREIFDDLMALGLTPNKSRRMRLPNIPQRYIGHFVRGYFDGDGCVWRGVSHPRRKTKTPAILVSFTSASMDFLADLFVLLGKQGLLGGSLFRSKKGNYSRLSFSTHDSLKIYKIMYNRPTKLFLDRKKLVFENFQKCARGVAG